MSWVKLKFYGMKGAFEEKQARSINSRLPLTIPKFHSDHGCFVKVERAPIRHIFDRCLRKASDRKTATCRVNMEFTGYLAWDLSNAVNSTLIQKEYVGAECPLGTSSNALDSTVPKCLLFDALGTGEGISHPEIRNA
jgi:hypothetical protein